MSIRPTESESVLMRDRTSTLDVSLLLSWWGEEEEGCQQEEDDELKEVEEEEEGDRKRELGERENDEQEEGISRWFSANQLFSTRQASFLDFCS